MVALNGVFGVVGNGDAIPRALAGRVIDNGTWESNSSIFSIDGSIGDILLSGTETDRLRDTLYTHAAGGAPAAPDFPFPPHYDGVYRDRRKVCGVQLYQAVGIGKEDRAAAGKQALENFHFFSKHI